MLKFRVECAKCRDREGGMGLFLFGEAVARSDNSSIGASKLAAQHLSFLPKHSWQETGWRN